MCLVRQMFPFHEFREEESVVDTARPRSEHEYPSCCSGNMNCEQFLFTSTAIVAYVVPMRTCVCLTFHRDDRYRCRLDVPHQLPPTLRAFHQGSVLNDSHSSKRSNSDRIRLPGIRWCSSRSLRIARLTLRGTQLLGGSIRQWNESPAISLTSMQDLSALCKTQKYLIGQRTCKYAICVDQLRFQHSPPIGAVNDSEIYSRSTFQDSTCLRRAFVVAIIKLGACT